MRENRNFDLPDVPGTSVYVRGMVFGNYYYRLRQKNVATLERLLELVLQVQRLIRDPSGNGIDTQDFNAALQSALRPGENALAAAIATVFSEMGATTPPGGGSPPLSPFNLGGAFQTCSPPYSVYQGGWSASFGASNYEVEYLHSSGAWTYANTFSITTGIYFSTPYNTAWRVRACNAYGCSGYSNTWSTPDVC